MTLPSLEGDSNRLRGTGSPAVIEMRPCRQDGDYSESCSVDGSVLAAQNAPIQAIKHTANTHVKMGADA